MDRDVLRTIPSVNELLEHPTLKDVTENVGHHAVVSGVRSFLSRLRQDVRDAASDAQVPSLDNLAQQIASWVTGREEPLLRPAINATGILLHTGLGRAPLAQQAIDEISKVARGYASLELDLASGERSQRVLCVERLLVELTGAEAALVVNNNAGATLLTLAALAAGREVIVSRGHLIEIGGSYRLPDVMAASGARLKEVGTTNKTRISDYQAAIGEETAALLNVHRSNFAIVGFTEETPLSDLVSLGRERGLPVIDDIGSGALLDFARYAVASEPEAGASIKSGTDIALFSGDKLLGGPQCGVIVGRRDLVRQIAHHPLARALRVGKLTLAALHATLRLYRDPAVAEREVPLLALLSTPIEQLRQRAERLAPRIEAVKAVASAKPLEDTSFLGGGSVPSQTLPTWCVAVTPASANVADVARSLRSGTPAVVGRAKQNRLLIDLRTVFPEEDESLVEAFTLLDTREL